MIVNFPAPLDISHIEMGTFTVQYNNLGVELKKNLHQDFPGGPVVKTARFHCSGAQLQCLVRELRFHMPRGTAKKKKKNYFFIFHSRASPGGWYYLGTTHLHPNRNT